MGLPATPYVLPSNYNQAYTFRRTGGGGPVVAAHRAREIIDTRAHSATAIEAASTLSWTGALVASADPDNL
jgi:hypothetical protein